MGPAEAVHYEGLDAHTESEVMKPLRVLVACEYSGIVRDAFIAAGCDALSCDLLPSERPGPHYQGDVKDLLLVGKWDLMIAHPPCKFLANSGVKHLYIGGKKVNGRVTQRWQDMRDAAAFYRLLRDAPVRYKAIENPIMHCHAREHIGPVRGQLQYIQPWQFGHGEIRATGLELIRLPKLVPTNIVAGRKPRVHHMSPGPERWKDRSRTLQGHADAMAAQWVEHVWNNR